jgi:hypothetical protein
MYIGVGKEKTNLEVMAKECFRNIKNGGLVAVAVVVVKG